MAQNFFACTFTKYKKKKLLLGGAPDLRISNHSTVVSPELQTLQIQLYLAYMCVRALDTLGAFENENTGREDYSGRIFAKIPW